MCLQTDLELKKNQIKKLNDEFNVEMFHTKESAGRKYVCCTTENKRIQKILLRSKRFEKSRKNRIKLNDLIKKVAQNINKTISMKYQLAPETIENRSFNPNNSKHFQEIYDFMRIRKIENN